VDGGQKRGREDRPARVREGVKIMEHFNSCIILLAITARDGNHFELMLDSPCDPHIVRGKRRVRVV
jgi:hypothetical protein